MYGRAGYERFNGGGLLKRIAVYGTTIELYFGVGCNGSRAYDMTKQDFRIFEDSALVKEFTYWCPDPTVRCAISTALVLDASGSMSGNGNAGAKAVGRSTFYCSPF